jgi:peroxiredoxin
MALTPSNMLPLGTPAPLFTLQDTLSGNTLSLADLKSSTGTVVMFICNHCPYVKHILSKLVAVAKTYQQQGVQFIAISSNDIDAYPEDAPSKMTEVGIQHGFSFPYLFDATQQVAKDYQAACTPDFYIFDKELYCVYRGRFDDSTPKNNKPVTGSELIQALECLLHHKPINSDQKPSIGCNIKWKEN